MSGASDRPTERLNRGANNAYKMTETKRQRGRPKGSTNKPKALVPKEMALTILDKMQPMMEKDEYEYHKGVILQGKKIAVEKELDILILLLRQQMVPALIAEIEGEQLPEGVEDPDPTAIKMPEFRKDVTERLKVLMSLIDLKMKQERARDDVHDSRSKPILEIFARRGIDGDRIRVAVEHTSGGMGGSPDDTERPADSVGEIPVALSERPLSLPGRGESEADRVIDHDSLGDSS